MASTDPRSITDSYQYAVYTLLGFPGCIDCVDGTEVRITKSTAGREVMTTMYVDYAL